MLTWKPKLIRICITFYHFCIFLYLPPLVALVVVKYWVGASDLRVVGVDLGAQLQLIN